jgi:3-keto-5-aminohexanoate cleavage enzyme
MSAVSESGAESRPGAPVIVNAALTGMVPTKDDNAFLPVTPSEIADDACRVAEAGAAVVHLHARDEGGLPTWRPDVYREIVHRIRELCPDVLLCVSTSGRVFTSFEERSAVLDLDGDEKPDLASLTLGSLNFPRQASVNDPEMIRRLAERMQEQGITPELELFDLGMADYLGYLVEREVLVPPFYANVLLGSLGTLAASAFNLATVVRSLPASTTWSGAGIGRFQLDVNAMAIAMGGHVRVGLEDNLWLDRARTVPAFNEALVSRVVALAGTLERAPATPDEARDLIGLETRVATA